MIILVEKGVEDSEFIYPYYRFQEEGFKMDIVAPQAKKEYIGEENKKVEKDTLIESPKDIPHLLRNTGKEPFKFLVVKLINS